jgi:hypothetical protein
MDLQNPTRRQEMRGLALMLAAGVALGGCEQVCGPVARSVVPPAQACAKPFERTVSFTRAQPGDRLVVEALGPDCSNPSMVGRVFDTKGRLVYTEMTSGRWMMNGEIFPPGGGTAQGAIDALYDIGGANSMNLPAWTGGPEPQKGNYGAYEALVPQIAYERLRQMNAPTLIKRGGGESGTIYIYDPEATMAIAVAKYAI